jgi:predicted adenylyl cyclase CyaB
MKSTLIELKARLKSISYARNIIIGMGAQKKGTYKQIDTYFNTTSGRLKLRKVIGEDSSNLVYYAREDIPGLKKSDIIILKICEPETLKAILECSIGVKVDVTKTREIYKYHGTQIHLDEVEELGTFVEFERPIQDLQSDREVLKVLMHELKIKPKDLVNVSYSDLKLDNLT